jgi:hypothetical protein
MHFVFPIDWIVVPWIIICRRILLIITGLCISARYIYHYRIAYLTIDNEEQYVLPNCICIEAYLAVTREEVDAILG